MPQFQPYQQTQPIQTPPQQMTPPTIHAEIVQVEGEQEATNYLYAQRLNLIYQFGDLSLVTPELKNEYKPVAWKQKLKQKGLKNKLIYIILRKIV